jgi:hypothetical protein
MTTGRVSNLLVHLLLDPASAVILGSPSLRTSDHILISHLRLVAIFDASYISSSAPGTSKLISKIKVRIKVILLTTVSRQARPCIRTPYGTRDLIYFSSMDIILRHLRFYILRLTL